MMRRTQRDTLRQRKTQQAAKRPKRTSPRQALLEWIKSAAIGLLIFLVLRTFVLQTFTIISGSMEQTLLVGDFLVVNKVAYGAMVPGTSARLPGYTEPRRGDIVVFRGPAEPIDIVKRVVGLPGDTLAMRAGVLHRNGVTVAEPYARRTRPMPDVTDPAMQWQTRHQLTDAAAPLPTRDNWGPLVVPTGQYFMLGDNRDESMDSRYWGPVPASNLKGRASVIYFNWSRTASNGIPVLGRVRWSRIGDRVR